MKILKIKHRTEVPCIRIKNTCTCGTKVIIDNMFDIIYSGDHAQLTPHPKDRIPIFGYICPGCEQYTKLNIKKSEKVQKALNKTIYDIDSYLSIVDDPFISYETKFQYCSSNGVPLTWELYKEAILKGDIL